MTLCLLFEKANVGRIEKPIFSTGNGIGFEKHYIRGKTNMQKKVGLAFAVVMAMTLAT